MDDCIIPYPNIISWPWEYEEAWYWNNAHSSGLAGTVLS